MESGERFVVISGCSGGGKSSLLAELAARGWPVVEEPGRRIVREELQGSGAALPWVNAEAFAHRAVEMALADRAGVTDEAAQWVFFDRSLIDAAAALEHVTGGPVLSDIGRTHRYHRTVFLTPPWPELFATDRERRHGFESAVEEYERIARAYPSLGYETILIPKDSVPARADFILDTLARNH
ncbi:AAA family ATPase [Pelagibacterium limicola]|uniref:AAA family ATPase n=1 Tax=Pelagibacterium limicola TaxID=2791022 RepID=UPI0018AFE0A1|nr:AAA family ATPase [Pelagibacterium limicola]